VVAERRSRAFGLFYTLGIGSSATAPFVFGLISDRAGVPSALALLAVLVLFTIPLTLPLRRALARPA
jgi:FSR family fosmidomycin resistance protein-like MFS transporter